MASKKSKQNKRTLVTKPKLSTPASTKHVELSRESVPLFSFAFLIDRNVVIFRSEISSFLEKIAKHNNWQDIQESRGFNYKLISIDQCKQMYLESFKNAHRDIGINSKKVVQMRVDQKNRIYGIRETSIFHVICLAPHDVF